MDRIGMNWYKKYNVKEKFDCQEKILDSLFSFVYDRQSAESFYLLGAVWNMERIIEQGILYDFYGPLLTKHQQEIYEAVVYNNLSLGEIAAEEGISRQGVHDLIKRCDKTLADYEAKLHLVKRFADNKKKIAKLKELINSLMESDSVAKEHKREINAIIDELYEGLD